MSSIYDYILKGHLGNVRMLLTTKKQTDAYPVASLKTTPLPNEKLYYSGLDTGRVNKSTVSGYPNDTYTDPNDFIQKLNGSGAKTGAGIVLKVMAGDKFNIRANSWYKKNGATPGSPTNPLVDLVAALAGSVGSISAAHGGATVAELTSSDVFTPGATSFLASQTVGTGKPKAYVNWVLFDEQFKLVSSSSGFDGAGNDQEFKTHLLENKPIHKNGYLYVYVSNATPNIDVFFDNLQVTHVRGPLVEETHYYPFGLMMAGISSKALAFGNPESKIRFQSQELNNDLGVNYYEFKYRSHDLQIGRFIQIDPLANDYVHNSTYAFSENKVTGHIELEGLEAVDIRGLVEKGIRQTSPNATDASVNKVMQSYDAGQVKGGIGATKMLKTAGIMALVVLQPEIGVPLAISDLTGVPVSPSPQAMSRTVIAAEASVVDEVVTIEQRANQIHGALPAATQRRTTTAVASATTAEGNQVTLVASSEKNLRPAQRAVLQPGEIAVSGKGHAEATIINHATTNGMTVSQVAASRPICVGCAGAISSAGAAAVSPLKKIAGVGAAVQ